MSKLKDEGEGSLGGLAGCRRVDLGPVRRDSGSLLTGGQGGPGESAM